MIDLRIVLFFGGKKIWKIPKLSENFPYFKANICSINLPINNLVRETETIEEEQRDLFFRLIGDRFMFKWQPPRRILVSRPFPFGDLFILQIMLSNCSPFQYVININWHFPLYIFHTWCIKSIIYNFPFKFSIIIFIEKILFFFSWGKCLWYSLLIDNLW